MPLSFVSFENKHTVLQQTRVFEGTDNSYLSLVDLIIANMGIRNVMQMDFYYKRIFVTRSTSSLQGFSFIILMNKVEIYKNRKLRAMINSIKEQLTYCISFFATKIYQVLINDPCFKMILTRTLQN